VNEQRVEELLRERPADEPDFVPRVLEPIGRVRRPGAVGPAGSGAWAIVVAVVIVAVLGWQSLATRHAPATSDSPSATPAPSRPSEATLPPGVIPWLDAAYVPPTPEPTASVGALPLCFRGDLVLLASGWGGATGSMAGGATLINTWANACRIEKLRDAVLRDADGHVVAQATFLVNLESDATNRLGLAPGQAASANVVWMNWCGNSIPRPLRLELSLTLDTDGGPQTSVLTAPVESEEPGNEGQTPRCDAPGGSSTLGVLPFEPVANEPSGHAAPACRAADMRAFAGDGGSAAGTWYTPVVLYNRSPFECSLATEPILELRDATGRLLVVTMPVRDVPSVIVVPAQSTAAARLGLSNWCLAEPPVPLAVDVLVGTGRVDVAGSTSGYSFGLPGCSSGLGTPPPSFGLEAGFALPDAAPPAESDVGNSLPVTLTATIPPSARPGKTFDYTVTLTNTSAYDKPINLAAECPSFVQRLFLPDAGGLIESRSLLNCAPAGTVTRGDSRTFEMQLAIPDDAHPGMATIVWQLGFSGEGLKLFFEVKA